MKWLRSSPARNLLGGVAYMLVISLGAVLAYMAQGWSPGDAAYMVVLTVFSVGYGEVHPLDTAALRAITIVLIVLGCTGMIFLTGVLVQLITLSGLQQLLGIKHMNHQIEQLRGHVVICGFGRIGNMLARELKAGGEHFVVIERSQERLEEARSRGYLCIHADANDDAALRRAGVGHARVLATVLPDDAANVFITLGARGLNPALQIIARGEAPSTVQKLVFAGANEVILPAHIGAERIAEIILYPRAAQALRRGAGSGTVEQGLHGMGLELELTVAEPGSAYAGTSVAEIESDAGGAFLVVAIDRPGGERIARPDAGTRVEPGDGVTLLVRANRVDALAGFAAAAS